jgi:hypothetical protein
MELKEKRILKKFIEIPGLIPPSEGRQRKTMEKGD